MRAEVALSSTSMKKPSLSVETFLVSLLAVTTAAGGAGCRSAERASAEPSAESSKPAPAASAAAPGATTTPAAAGAGAAAAPVVAADEGPAKDPKDQKREATVTAVDAGVAVPVKKKAASASCGAGGCSPDMKKKPH